MPAMAVPNNLEMLLLAIWLILFGLLTAPFLGEHLEVAFQYRRNYFPDFFGRFPDGAGVTFFVAVFFVATDFSAADAVKCRPT